MDSSGIVSPGRGPCGLAACVALCLTLLAPPVMASGRTESWRRELSEIDQELRDGHYAAAQRKSRKLAAKMVQGLGRGDGAAYSLAVVSVFRALAEAGLGNKEEARWFWWTGWNLFNDITVTDLSPYGAPGEYLRGLKFRQGDGWEDLEMGWALNGAPLAAPQSRRGFTPPKIRQSTRPVFPDAARIHALGGSYAAQVIVNTDGSIAEPLVLREVVDPALAYVVLDTLRGWEFSPALRDGEPIVTFYTLTIHFAFRTN